MVNGDGSQAGFSGVVPPASMDPARAFAEAEALERAGRISEAEQIYRSLLRVFPNHPVLLHSLALAVKGRGETAEAETLLRRAIAVEPREPAFHNNLGNLLRQKGSLGEAEASYRSAIGLKPDYAEAHYNLGVVLEEMGRAEEAFTAFHTAISFRPAYAEALTRIGAIFIQRAEYEEALAELDKAVAAAPNYFDAYYYRGWALSSLGRHKDAIADLEHAAGLKPGNFETALAIANALRDAGQNDEALAAIWKLVEMQPARVATHDEINRFAWTAGRKDMFLKSFAYAREREGDNPDLLLLEAGFRARGNENAEAERLLRHAHNIAPERADVAGMLGRALAQQKKFADSFSFFDTAIRADPVTMLYRQEFGFALLSDGQASEALRVFEEARALQPFDQLTMSGLSLAYRELGDSRYRELVDLANHVRAYEIKVPAGFSNARDFNRALIEELQKFHTSTVEPIDQSLRGGTQTTGDLFSQKSLVIQKVRDSISEAVADYIRAMPAGSNHPLFMRRDEKFTYSGSWSCQLASNGYHANHVHPKGWISSAYYVHLPDSVDNETQRQGWLKFCESNLSLGERDKPEHHVKPIVGRLVLFPSYYWHGTVPFTSSDNRVTIAFDVVPGVVPQSALPQSAY